MRNRKQNLQFPYFHKDHVSHLLIKFITCDTTTNISKCNFAKSCQILFCLRLAEDVLHVTRHSFRRVLAKLTPRHRQSLKLKMSTQYFVQQRSDCRIISNESFIHLYEGHEKNQFTSLLIRIEQRMHDW